MAAISLENFEVLENSMDVAAPKVVADLEATRIASFEKGYQAGWDDAAKTEAETKDRLDAEIGRNLEEMSFSFSEAQRNVSLSLEQLLRDMANLVFPALFAENFGEIVAELIKPVIEEAANLNARLICAPESVKLVEAVIQKSGKFALSVDIEPSFSKHQIKLELGHETHEFDGNALLIQMRKLIDARLRELKQENAHVA